MVGDGAAGQRARTFFAEVFHGNGPGYARAKVVETRTRLLATGRFLTILPLSVLKFAARPPSTKALPIELPRVGPIGVATLKNRALSSSAQLFIDCAREVAKPLAKQK